MPQTGQPFNPYKLFVGSFLPNALLEFSGISPSAKLVWARLAQYAGKDGRAFPKVSTIASGVALGERQTLKLLQELERAGFLRRIKASGVDRLKHFSDTYVFLWHECLSLPPELFDGPDLNDSSPPDLNDSSPPSKRILSRESKEPPISPKGDEGFGLFWQAYDHKKSIGQAEKAWRKIDSSLLPVILAAIERLHACEKWTKQNGKYRQHPATWLNAKGWEDEVSAPPPSPIPSPPSSAEPHPIWGKIVYAKDVWYCGCYKNDPTPCRSLDHGKTLEEVQQQ